ncbi:hypothetical protein GQ457_15G009520 [Hibiscus cannabinus]
MKKKKQHRNNSNEEESLKGNGRFLLGGNQPSVADLCLVCEIMQLEGPAQPRIIIISSTTAATEPFSGTCDCFSDLPCTF